MGGTDAWGNRTQKYHQLAEIETTNNTTQYLELTGLSTNYAMLEFTFTGWFGWILYCATVGIFCFQYWPFQNILANCKW